MTASNLGYRPFLDGLRALAVLGVLLFHFDVGPLTGGYVGVDVFFVLSGFLITGLIDTGMQHGTFSFAHFYERRCRRILPALFIMCAISVVIALVLFMPFDYKNFSKSLKGAALFYSNMIFARTNGYFDAPLSTMPLLHTWSLAVEEQFYLIFPPLFYGVYKIAKGRRGAICAAVGAMFIASLAFNIYFITVSPDKTFYILPTRAWELLAGSLTFMVLRSLPLGRMTAEILSIIGLACLAWAYAVYDRNTLFPGWAAVLPCLGTVLVIWSNLGQDTVLGRVLSVRPLVLIGLISYGLYLYHWPVMVFTRYFLDRAMTMPETVMAIALTFAMAIASYRLVEHPIRTGAMLPKRRQVFLWSLAGIAALTAMAMIGSKSGGLPGRFSDEVLQYVRSGQDLQDWERRVPAFEILNAENALRIGAAGHAKPSFLLWGDSHAEAIAPGLDARAKTAGKTGLFVEYSGCLPLIDVARLDHSAKNAPCEDVGGKVLELADHFKIKHIILAGRWDDVFGWEDGSIEMGRPEPVIAFTGKDGRQITHGAALAPSLMNTVNTLRARGIHVWVVEQVPPYLFDVPTGLSKAVYFGRDPKNLGRSFVEIEARRKGTNEAFAPLRGMRGVSFIDPANKICPDKTTCLITHEGNTLYRDNNHLSVYGSLWVQAIFAPVFGSAH